MLSNTTAVWQHTVHSDLTAGHAANYVVVLTARPGCRADYGYHAIRCRTARQARLEARRLLRWAQADDTARVYEARPGLEVSPDAWRRKTASVGRALVATIYRGEDRGAAGSHGGEICIIAL